MRPFLFVLGTRPEALKLAPVLQIFAKNEYPSYVYATGQHEKLCRDALSLFDVQISSQGRLPMDGTLSEILSSLLVNLSSLGTEFSAIIVQGDTISAYGGAIFGFFSGIPVIHIEAGLRSYDSYEPYPEEMFRKSISTMADLHFCTTKCAKDNLLSEKIPPDKIVLSGNTILDTIRQISSPPVQSGPILISLHRRENLKVLDSMLEGIKRLIISNPTRKFLFSVHPSPVFAQKCRKTLTELSNLILSDPLPPNAFYGYLKGTPLVLTDSGGIEEECAVLGVPVLVLRNKTEREQELREGKIILVGTDADAIYNVANQLLKTPKKQKKPPTESFISPSEVIFNEILRRFNAPNSEKRPLCR